MKKYNLSNIMKRAWELVKKVGFGISEALKKAWSEAKKGTLEMTGTEKQIAFAKKLVEKMNEQFDAIITDCKNAHPEKVGAWEAVKSGYNRIMNESNAGCVIDTLKNINKTTYQEYYKELFLNVKYGTDKMCERIRKEVYAK